MKKSKMSFFNAEFKNRLKVGAFLESTFDLLSNDMSLSYVFDD